MSRLTVSECSADQLKSSEPLERPQSCQKPRCRLTRPVPGRAGIRTSLSGAMPRPFVWLFRFEPPIGVEDDHTIAEAAVKMPVSLARLVKHHDPAIGALEPWESERDSGTTRHGKDQAV